MSKMPKDSGSDPHWDFASLFKLPPEAFDVDWREIDDEGLAEEDKSLPVAATRSSEELACDLRRLFKVAAACPVLDVDRDNLALAAALVAVDVIDEMEVALAFQPGLDPRRSEHIRSNLDVARTCARAIADNCGSRPDATAASAELGIAAAREIMMSLEGPAKPPQ